MLKKLFTATIITICVSLNAKEPHPITISGTYAGDFSIKQVIKIPRPPTSSELAADAAEMKKQLHSKKKNKKSDKKKGNSTKEQQSEKPKTRFRKQVTTFEGSLAFIITPIANKNKRKHKWSITMKINNKNHKIEEKFKLFMAGRKLTLTPLKQKKSVFTEIAELMFNNLLTKKCLIDLDKNKVVRNNTGTERNRGILLVKLKSAQQYPDNIADIFIVKKDDDKIIVAGDNSFLYKLKKIIRQAKKKQKFRAVFLRKKGKLVLNSYSFNLKNTTEFSINGKNIDRYIKFNIKRTSTK